MGGPYYLHQGNVVPGLPPLEIEKSLTTLAGTWRIFAVLVNEESDPSLEELAPFITISSPKNSSPKELRGTLAYRDHKAEFAIKSQLEDFTYPISFFGGNVESTDLFKGEGHVVKFLESGTRGGDKDPYLFEIDLRHDKLFRMFAKEAANGKAEEEDLLTREEVEKWGIGMDKDEWQRKENVVNDTGNGIKNGHGGEEDSNEQEQYRNEEKEEEEEEVEEEEEEEEKDYDDDEEFDVDDDADAYTEEESDEDDYKPQGGPVKRRAPPRAASGKRSRTSR